MLTRSSWKLAGFRIRTARPDFLLIYASTQLIYYYRFNIEENPAQKLVRSCYPGLTRCKSKNAMP